MGTHLPGESLWSESEGMSPNRGTHVPILNEILRYAQDDDLSSESLPEGPHF